MVRKTPRKSRQGVPGWLPYALGGLVLVTGLLLALLPWGTLIPWLSISLHSLLDADYSPDLNPTRLAPARLALAADALRDQGFGLGTATPGDYLATLQTGMLTPVATVTPRPGETLFPLITPTATFTLVPPTLTATLPPTGTATPTWTLTPTTSPTLAASATVGPGTFVPSPTRRPTQAPTRRPTNPGPGQPTVTPTRTLTSPPPATNTPRPTPVPPTATRQPTVTRQPTATQRPYPPPPYP